MADPASAVSVENAVQQIARKARLSPKLATILLLTLVIKDGHALVRLVAPPEAETRAIDDAVRRLTREVEVILSRLFDRETLIVPTFDATCKQLLVSSESLETERAFLAPVKKTSRSNATPLSETSEVLKTMPPPEPHVPQALILPHLDRRPPSAQIALLECVRDGHIHTCETNAGPHHHAADIRKDGLDEGRSASADGTEHRLPDGLTFVAIVANEADYGGLFLQLADRIALSCTFTVEDVALLDGGAPEPFRTVPIAPLLPPVAPLPHQLRTYVSDLLSALRLHLSSPQPLVSARAHRFLPELAARRAALAGHGPTPADVRFVLEAATSHRLPHKTSKEAIEEVISIV